MQCLSGGNEKPWVWYVLVWCLYKHLDGKRGLWLWILFCTFLAAKLFFPSYLLICLPTKMPLLMTWCGIHLPMSPEIYFSAAVTEVQVEHTHVIRGQQSPKSSCSVHTCHRDCKGGGQWFICHQQWKKACTNQEQPSSLIFQLLSEDYSHLPTFLFLLAYCNWAVLFVKPHLGLHDKGQDV